MGLFRHFLGLFLREWKEAERASRSACCVFSGVRSWVWCVAVCCSVLQCVAVCGSVFCCSVLQSRFDCRVFGEVQKLRICQKVDALQCVAVCCSVLQCVAVCCSVLKRVAVCCSVLQCVAVCCSVLHSAAVCCKEL